MAEKSAFRNQVEKAINCHSMENGSNTPDFILAEYLTDCLAAFDKASTAREKWYGKALRIGGITELPSLAETGRMTLDPTDPNE